MEERFKIFSTLISNISRKMHKIKAEEMAEFNLKSSHLSCIYYLYKSSSLTAKELCDVCDADKANVSRTIKFLETNGYIVCKSTASKRYRTQLELTQKGIEVGRRISKKIGDALCQASEGLSDEHRKIMYDSLSLISNNLQKMCDDYDENN